MLKCCAGFLFFGFLFGFGFALLVVYILQATPPDPDHLYDPGVSYEQDWEHQGTQ